MAVQIDYSTAAALLHEGLAEAERSFAEETQPPVPDELVAQFDVIFSSRTQAYREVLLGIIVVRILYREADLRLPYTSQGDLAFNGRTLDQMAVNPFLKEHEIPSSNGPYLNVFRRQVRFDTSTRSGLRDQTGYDALLLIIGYIERQDDDAQLRALLTYTLYRFVLLREAANVQVARIQRISLRQYARLLDLLLACPSGGRFPVIIVQAMLETIRESFSLDWTIRCQGINVSDRSAGMEGDITISRDGTVLIGIEVTERPVDESRVVSTFRTKIAPAAVEDYVFMVNLRSIGPEALRQADQYFAQGHEVNFVDIREWVLNSLVTVGHAGRSLFNRHLQAGISAGDVPTQMKTAWNSAIADITAA